MAERGRFAPTPSGRMHLGNVFSALLAWLSVRAAHGELVLRIEDLDTLRCSAENAEILKDDLRWLGLTWDAEQPDQSTCSEYYESILDRLRGDGVSIPAGVRAAISKTPRTLRTPPTVTRSTPAPAAI